MAEFTSAPIKNLSAVGIRLRLKWHPDSTVLIGTERANVSRLVCWSETGRRRVGYLAVMIGCKDSQLEVAMLEDVLSELDVGYSCSGSDELCFRAVVFWRDVLGNV